MILEDIKSNNIEKKYFETTELHGCFFLNMALPYLLEYKMRFFSPSAFFLHILYWHTNKLTH